MFTSQYVGLKYRRFFEIHEEPLFDSLIALLCSIVQYTCIFRGSAVVANGRVFFCADLAI